MKRMQQAVLDGDAGWRTENGIVLQRLDGNATAGRNGKKGMGMKHAKWWMGMMVAACVVRFAPSQGMAATAIVDGLKWTYTISAGKATVTAAPQTSGQLTIPSKLGGYPVTCIGRLAFFGCEKMTSVVIPNSVTCIGDQAFLCCEKMTSVVIPNSVTNIGESAFDTCTGLASVTIPASVTSIGFLALAGCDGMKSITVSANNKMYSSKEGVLFTKDGKTLVWSPCGKSGAYAVPSGVTRIGDMAFNGSQMTSVSIPSSVTTIADDAFYYSYRLQSINVAADNRVYASKDGVLFTKDGKTLLCCPCGRKTPTYFVPTAATCIGDNAFLFCTNLTSVIIPNGVTSIGAGGFNCAGLTSITIPGSITSIGGYAFLNCHKLKTIYVPESWRGTSKLADAGLPTGCVVKYATYQLALGASARTFTADAASSKELKVTATMPWAAQSSVSWVTLKTASGNGNGTILYNVAANTGSGTRTGKLTVVGGGFTRTFTVTQSGKSGGGTSAKLTLGASSRSFTAAAASNKELGVTANVSWTAKSSASWLAVKRGSGTGNGSIIYDVAANTGSSSRTAKITVTGGGFTRTFTVTQSGKGTVAAKLTLGASSRTFTAAAANSKELGVTANVSWTAKSSASWLAVKTGTGSGSGKIVYNVAANSGTGTRTAKLTVTGGGLTRMFTVTQNGKTWYEQCTIDGITWTYLVSGGTASIETGKVQAGVPLPAIPRSTTGEIVVPSKVGGYPVTRIGDNAFYLCWDLTAVTIPDCVTSIGKSAFLNCCGLQSLTIPAKVASIGIDAFMACSALTHFSVASGNQHFVASNGVLFSKDMKTLVGWPGGRGGKYVIPDGVTSIAPGAFCWCRSLTSVVIPNSVTSIGKWAFDGCDALTSVTIPASVASIGDFAFRSCGDLTSVTIPDSVTNIGLYAFDGCTGLATLYVPEVWKSKYVEGKYWSTPVLWSEYAGVPEGCNVVYVQVPSRLALGASSRTFSAAAASSKELGVTANVSWTAKSSASWLAVKTGKGSGNGKVVYNVAANTGSACRTGKITVSGGGLTRTFTVTQSGKTGGGATATLTLGASARSFTASAANSKELEVAANVSWTAKSGATWLTVKTGSGKGNGTIVYNVAANSGTGARTGTLSVTGGGLTRTFTVTQSGKSGSGTAATLTLGASARSFTAAAANSKELGVTANVSWTAKSSVSWLSLRTASGSGNGVVVYDVAANTGTAARTGTITVSGGGITQTFAVTQSGKQDGGADLYMVVDLSGGSGAAKYPVSYLSAVPAGGWTDEYKTTKLVLRRIEPGTFMMCGSTQTTLSKPYYIGVFEVTQKQYERVTGRSASAAKRPVPMAWNTIRGNTSWPASSEVSADSFMGRMRARTGLSFDLPTEAQWEYACRAGTTTTYSYGNSANGDYMWYSGNSSASPTHDVGLKLPNPWGLYDMHGNVQEWCLDWRGALSGGTDPKGPSSGTDRVERGGTLNYGADIAASGARNNGKPSETYWNRGFRLTLTLSQGKAIKSAKVAEVKRAGAKVTRTWVTTSDGSWGDAVADGDEGTGWSPSGTGGSWVALSFEEARDVGRVEVVGEDLPEGMRTLVSQDGDNWSEEGGAAVNYLWVILPDEGAVPTVREIVTEP